MKKPIKEEFELPVGAVPVPKELTDDLLHRLVSIDIKEARALASDFERQGYKVIAFGTNISAEHVSLLNCAYVVDFKNELEEESSKIDPLELFRTDTEPSVIICLDSDLIPVIEANLYADHCHVIPTSPERPNTIFCIRKS